MSPTPLAELIAGTALVATLGRSARRRGGGISGASAALDFAVGLALATPIVLFLGVAGLPVDPTAIATSEVLLAAALVFRNRNGRGPDPTPVSRPGPFARRSEGLLGACFLLAAGKWLRAPLWTWDHYAIWGMKARRLFPGAGLDLGFLQLKALDFSHPGYPIGLPVAWRVLALREPDALAFKGCHVLFALALVALLRKGLLLFGLSRTCAALACAAVCLSPLFWDTEIVGTAEMPLALFAVAGAVVLIQARQGESIPRLAAVAGLLLGFLCWIKVEGMALGALLSAAAAVAFLARSGRANALPGLARFAGPFLAWNAGALLTSRLLLARGAGFFQGEWRWRTLARAGHPAAIAGALARELSEPDWLGFWFLFAAAGIVALAARKRAAALLLAAVLAQMLIYSAVYFATYLDPIGHIESSFFRITAALVPLATLGIAALVEESRPVTRGEPRRAPREPPRRLRASPSA